MSWNRLLICITLVLVLWLTLVLSTNGHRKVSETQDFAIADTIYDTIIEEVHDTIYSTKPIFVEIKTVDTVFIPDTTYLYVVQKHYQKNGLYDLWISGIEPLNLDSAIVYQKTRYNTITKEVEKIVYKNKLEIYTGGGLFSHSGDIFPYMGISLSTKKKTLYTLNLGLYQKEPIYFIDVKLKINN